MYTFLMKKQLLWITTQIMNKDKNNVNILIWAAVVTFINYSLSIKNDSDTIRCNVSQG